MEMNRGWPSILRGRPRDLVLLAIKSWNSARQQIASAYELVRMSDRSACRRIRLRDWRMMLSINDSHHERKTLVVFARYPRAGHCKTRLIPAWGEERAAQLHNQMVQHTLDTARQLRERVDVRIVVYGTDADPGNCQPGVARSRLSTSVTGRSGATLAKRCPSRVESR